MKQAENSRVAVLGLGIIGSRACERLLAAGWNVKCWSRTQRNLPSEVSSPQEAVKDADIVSIYLKDAPSVRSVMEQAAASLAPGTMVLNHATLDIETTLWLDELCQKHACRFLDAPFTGSKAASAAGQLMYYIGGDQGLADEVSGYLSITGRGTLYCGDMGSATVVKLATNLISACSVQAMAESLAIATSQGVSAECLIRAVGENACSSVLATMKMPAMATGDYDTHFSLANMGKDSRYMVSLAKSAGLDVPAITAVSSRMASLEAEGLGQLDYCAVAQPYLQKP